MSSTNTFFLIRGIQPPFSTGTVNDKSTFSVNFICRTLLPTDIEKCVIQILYEAGLVTPIVDITAGPQMTFPDGIFPDNIDSHFTVICTGGLQSILAQEGPISYRPTFQIYGIGIDHFVTRAKMDSFYKALDGLSSRVVTIS